MKRFSLFSLLGVAIIAAFLSLNACQKEAIIASTDSLKTEMSVTDRSPTNIIYGVTLYDGVNPCRIIGINQNTGAIVSNVVATYTDANNTVNQLDNLKGICLTDLSDAHFLTTGFLAPGNLYNEALFKVNPVTGECSFASNSTVNTVSDLEYEPTLGVFYGLRAGTNGLVTILDNTNNFSTYSSVAITGIAAGYTLQGISLVLDKTGTYLVGCATDANPANRAQLYRITPGLFNATATLITNLDPVADLATGHCAIGFDRDINQLSINRSNIFGGGFGLNRLPWANPLANPAGTGFWTAAGINFEDLSSSIY